MSRKRTLWIKRILQVSQTFGETNKPKHRGRIQIFPKDIAIALSKVSRHDEFKVDTNRVVASILRG